MDHLEGWRQEAGRFADVLDGADDLDAPVPACPEWDVADLGFHVGWVLDRFRRIAGQRLTEKDQVRQLGATERPADDAVLPGWFRERVDALDPVLAALGPDEPVWNFTRTPHVGAWVTRRMHLELLVHRHDLEEAVGRITPIDEAVATDGVDELLTVLSTTGTRWEARAPATLQASDASSGHRWQVRLEPGDRAVPEEPGDTADVVLAGPSPALLLAGWRRRPVDTVEVTGDPDLATAVLAAIGR